MEHKILNISLALGAIVILFLSLFNPARVFGYYDSTNSTQIFSINKNVRSIGDTQYYDNIEASKKTFYEKDVIEFQIRVENIRAEVIYNINVKDMLPKYLSLVFYPGTFDNDQYIVEWNIDRLEAGESKTYLIRAKINDSIKLNTLTKQTNKAEACGGGKCEVDNASYFIGKASIPATGASDIIFKTGVIASIAGLGLWFRKKARGY